MVQDNLDMEPNNFWQLLPNEKRGASRLAYLLLLKWFQKKAGFPGNIRTLPTDLIACGIALTDDPVSRGDFQVKNIQEITTRSIDWKLIEEQYDEMIKHAVALKIGTATAETIIRKFARSNNQHPTFKAFMELGKAIKTIFLCRYLNSVELRQQINAGLNVVENWNSANDFVYYGKSGEITSNSLVDQEISMLCLHLLQTSISYVNTLLVEDLLQDKHWRELLSEEDYRALTALFYLHINPYGSFELDLTYRLLIKLTSVGKPT